MLESFPLEWIPVSLTPAYSADANQCGMWCFSGDLLVMPCVILQNTVLRGGHWEEKKSKSFQVIRQPARQSDTTGGFL